MGLVTINILTWNHRTFLPRCLECVLQQTYEDIELVVTDNASDDGSPEFVKDHFPAIRLIENGQNIGYAAGHNQAIHVSTGKYFMPVNPDVFMQPTFLEELVKHIRTAKDVGMGQGKLLKVQWQGGDFVEEGVLDSVGLEIHKNRKNYEQGHGEKAQDRYEYSQPIFGPLGAAPLYKREMLEDIAVHGEYFDESFFAYREEVDLAWRAQLLGWKCIYVPSAKAFHVHAYNPATRKDQPRWQRRLQFRNRYLLMLKNDSLKNFLLHFPHILGYELLALAYVLLREPHLLGGYLDFLQLVPDAWRKRRVIQARKRVSDSYMRQWFQ
jgi:GT2 family glycosyltransferase